MAALLSQLPAPTKQYLGPVAPAAPEPANSRGSVKEVPPYLKRQKFVPRRPEDFGDGGAFPEIHVAQYPLDMGRPDAVKSNRTLALTVTSSGEVAYDALLRQGSNKGKIIHADHKALVPKVDRIASKEGLAKPDEEEVEKTVQETQAALERVVQNKLGLTNVKALPNAPGAPQFIKYTPSQQGPAYNSGAQHRIIKMHDMPVDPLEPPKFRHTKVPRGPGSPPVPVMHSPPRPVTAQDQADWKIPPCISNWKNNKGYTIPLDKRLAADGRGLQQTVINDKFAGLSEALFMAEAKAREAITMRAQVQKELLAKEKAKKEAELRELAMKARMERGGGLASRLDGTGAGLGGGGGLPPPPPLPGAGGEGYAGGGRGGGGGGRGEYEDDDLPPPPPRGGRGGGDDEGEEETAEEREERRKRDELREERRRERERERRLEARDAQAGPSKKSKLTRDRDRDVSEKVALGMARVNAGEVAYDQRLFNQDQGMTSGFGAEDSYNLYEGALFADRSAAGGLHRPKSAPADEDDAGAGAAGAGGKEGGAVRTDKFKADRGFKGTEATAGGGAAARGGPVQFERQAAQDEADPFGLDQFLTDVKKGRGGGGGVGNGAMQAAGGGSSLDDQMAGGSGRRMNFTSGRN